VATFANGREAAVGLANIETGEQLTPGHRFRVASVSKVFIATLVDQWEGRQRWICSTAWRRTTLSLGALLLILDNSVDPDNTRVKKN